MCSNIPVTLSNRLALTTLSPALFRYQPVFTITPRLSPNGVSSGSTWKYFILLQPVDFTFVVIGEQRELCWCCFFAEAFEMGQCFFDRDLPNLLRAEMSSKTVYPARTCPRCYTLICFAHTHLDVGADRRI